MFFKKKSKPQIEFPNDEDGDALRRLYEDGIDFGKPHNIDFYVAVPDSENGEKIKELVEQEGFSCSLEENEDTEDWTCYCTKEMMLEYNQIIKIQELLDRLSQPYKGFSDGWGTFGD